MSLKGKRIAVLTAAVLLVGVVTFLFLFRVTSSEVVVYSVEQVNPDQLDSKMTFTDKKTIKAFTYAVRFSKRQPGDFKMAPPTHRFVLDNEDYYLWLLPFAQVAKVKETGTIYKLRKSSVSSLQSILGLN